jgi:proteasome assembly chaperone (PAC2) family protein
VERRAAMWLDFESKGQLKLVRPALLVALSTSVSQYKALYSQARELSNYLLKTLKFDEVAVLHSSALQPEVIVKEDGTAVLPTCKFYVHRGKRDLLLFAGDSSPGDDQLEFTRIVLDFADKAGVKEVYSVGARWSENPVPAFDDPHVNGFATDKDGVKKLKENGVDIIESEPAPFFASIIVGMAPEYGMKGYKISVDHGEPIPHTRSVIKMLEVLSAIIGFKVEMDELKALVKAPPQERPPGTGPIYQ